MVKGSKKYIPQRGDLVWLDFNPRLGHEQRGRRPALVLSYKSYNEKTGLALFCPVTSEAKGYPFEVALDGGTLQGNVLADQIKSLDWTVRNIEYMEKLKEIRLDEVISKVKILFE